VALRWIQANIHLFHGDPKRVIIFGGNFVCFIKIHTGHRVLFLFQQNLPEVLVWLTTYYLPWPKVNFIPLVIITGTNWKTKNDYLRFYYIRLKY
jgi:hypothetical protein